MNQPSYTLSHGFMVCLAAALAACSEEHEPSDEGAQEGEAQQQFVIGTLVDDSDGNSAGYVTVLPSVDLEGERVELQSAREFAGLSDSWAQGGYIYVAHGDEPSITKYSVDARGALSEEDTLSFSRYGIASAGFWNNTFVSAGNAEKVYDSAGWSLRLFELR